MKEKNVNDQSKKNQMIIHRHHSYRLTDHTDHFIDEGQKENCLTERERKRKSRIIIWMMLQDLSFSSNEKSLGFCYYRSWLTSLSLIFPLSHTLGYLDRKDRQG